MYTWCRVGGKWWWVLCGYSWGTSWCKCGSAWLPVKKSQVWRLVHRGKCYWRYTRREGCGWNNSIFFCQLGSGVRACMGEKDSFCDWVNYLSCLHAEKGPPRINMICLWPSTPCRSFFTALVSAYISILHISFQSILPFWSELSPFLVKFPPAISDCGLGEDLADSQSGEMGAADFLSSSCLGKNLGDCCFIEGIFSMSKMVVVVGDSRKKERHTLIWGHVTSQTKSSREWA